MKWKLIEVQQETDHPYLNYFTLHYQVEKDGESKEVFYRICSRHSKSSLQCFANPKKLSAAGVLIPIYRIEEDGSISLLFTSQFRPSFNRRLTSFCAGLVDQDDPDLFFTAVREAKEECGYQVTDLELLSKPGPTSSGLSDETTAIILARAIKKEETHLEEIEDIETFFVPLSKADEILDDPERTVPVNVRMIVKYLQQYWKGNKIHETRID